MESARGRRRRRPSLSPAAAAIAFVLLFAWAIPADAYQPVLHEYIPPDDREDVTYAATTADGDLPAALDTKSGVVRAPSARPPSEADKAYQEPLSQRSQYRPDRDTRRPSAIHYDDPFVPSIAPFKRLRAFDMVANDYALGVRDATLARVPEGGQAVPGEDEFYADLVVDFGTSSSVLIPSVGPGSRILRQHTTPPTPIEIWRDGAENWYARATSPQRGRVHLVLQIAAPRTAFGGELAMPSWSALGAVPPLPPRPARGFARVKAALNLTRELSPTDTVRRLVAYFRAFVPSDDPPFGYDDIYVDLALSQKGVCRHRAFAFLVTALGLGIPARMIANEAHAWVEVRAETGWQRIDLGGAAAAIEEETAEPGPAYEPPSDPFDWPGSAENGSGRAVAMRARESASTRRRPSGTGPWSTTDPNSADPSGASAADPSMKGPSAADPDGPARDHAADDPRPVARLTVREGEVRVHAGGALPVAGRVEAEGAGCSQLRVDIALRHHDTGRTTAIGSLGTDERGAFEGNVFLPVAFPVGDYDVIVSTPGDARCGPGAIE